MIAKIKKTKGNKKTCSKTKTTKIAKRIMKKHQDHNKGTQCTQYTY